MNIDRLKEIVGEALRDADNFVLATTALKSGAADNISNDFLPDYKLRLSSAKVVPSDPADAVTVRGTGIDLPFKGMAVELRFYLEGTTAAFSLTATGNSEWTLAKSFPPFARTFVAKLRFVSTPNPPRLFLNTHACEQPVGLYFDGVLDLNKASRGIASFVGLENLQLKGPVVLKKNGSRFHDVNLVASIRKPLNMGIATIEELTFKVGSYLDVDPKSKKHYAAPFIELAAVIPFNSTKQGQTRIPISAQARNFDSAFRFKANLTDVIDVVIDDLRSLARVGGLSNLLPGDVEFSRVLKLNDLFFDFEPLTTKVRFVGIGVQSTTPWRVLHIAETNKNLEVQNVQLRFVVADPFNAATKWLTISGEFAIGNAGTIEASMEYPNWVVRASLKQGTTLNLTDVVRVFKDPAEGVPNMEVQQFALEVSSKKFSVDLELDGDLVIPDTQFGLVHASVLIESGTSGSTCLFRGVLLVGGTSVALSADYSGSGGGWRFAGSTGPGQQVPIGNLIQDLAQKFGDLKLPTAINSLVVEDLSATFETSTKKVTFGCKGKFNVDNTDVAIKVDLEVKQVKGVYTREFAGTLRAGGLDFDLHFVQSGSSDSLVATYKPTRPDQSLDVKQLIGSVSSTVATYVPDGLKIQLKDVIFAYSKSAQQGATSKFIFGMDVGTSINLSNLPLVGQELPKEATVSVDNLQILFSSAGLTTREVENFNTLIPLGASKLPVRTPAPPVVIEKGFSIAALMNFGGSKHFLRLPDSESRPRVASDLLAASAPSDNVKWFVVQKTFGPVFFDKVGVEYQSAKLRFLLNAALSAAGLTLSLDGLSIGTSLSEFKPEFDLRGLGIDYRNEAVQIGGAFLRTGPDSYNGAAVIKTKQFTLSALGSYTKLAGKPSLFIYAFLNYPLGGPAFFFVTGLAAGFGYNRKLIAPSIDNVAEFPLVKQATGGELAPKDVMEALEKLQNFVPPAVGEMFLAVGVRFNSFKLIDSFALLTFEFGSRFVVNLLGVSRAVVPTPETGKNITPLAKVEIAWKATFDPDQGCLAVDARLTPNSYILSKDCHLSGGYAFYSWFSGDHAGDFVQTLGGYHPDFEKTLPAHYPRVPRLAFDWRVSNALTIQGKAYYALTGSALMAGGYLEVLYREGNLRAWLKLGADFLIGWKPYHYDARLYVNVGASYTFDINLLFGRIRTTISVDVGADLHLWGPDFSGTAHIDISVISFTIAFGAGASQVPKPIENWSIFQQSFLPEKNVCSISVQDGLVRKVEADQTERWIINPKQFSLAVNSAIPFKHAAMETDSGTDLVPVKANTKFGIRPMKVSAENLHSTLTISIKRGKADAKDEFSYKVVQKTVPKGLWDKQQKLDLDADAFLDGVPSGIEIKPGKELKPGASATIDLEKFDFKETYLHNAFAWEKGGGFERSRSPVDPIKEIKDGIGNNSQRAALLRDLGVRVDVNIRGDVIAGDFLSAPQIGNLNDSIS